MTWPIKLKCCMSSTCGMNRGRYLRAKALQGGREQRKWGVTYMHMTRSRRMRCGGNRCSLYALKAFKEGNKTTAYSPGTRSCDSEEHR